VNVTDAARYLLQVDEIMRTALTRKCCDAPDAPEPDVVVLPLAVVDEEPDEPDEGSIMPVTSTWCPTCDDRSLVDPSSMYVLPLPAVPAVRPLLLGELPDADSLLELGELLDADDPVELDEPEPLPIEALVRMYDPDDDPALADDPLVPVAPASPRATQPVSFTWPASLLLERLVPDCEPLVLVPAPLDPL